MTYSDGPEGRSLGDPPVSMVLAAGTGRDTGELPATGAAAPVGLAALVLAAALASRRPLRNWRT